MASTIHHHLSQSWLDLSRITLDSSRINISTEKQKGAASFWYKSTEALKSTEPLQVTKEMTFLYQGNTDISVWSIFLFSCHVWETTVLRATLRVQEAVSTKSPTHGDNSSQIKELRAIHCSTFSSASRTLTASPKQHPQSCLHHLVSLKGPSATSKGSIWSRMTGRVPWNTESASVPPAIHNLHTAQMDQILTFAYKESSFFSYSSCQSVLHFIESFNLLRKQEVSHIQPSTNSKVSFLVAVTFVTQN